MKVFPTHEGNHVEKSVKTENSFDSAVGVYHKFIESIASIPQSLKRVLLLILLGLTFCIPLIYSQEDTPLKGSQLSLAVSTDEVVDMSLAAAATLGPVIIDLCCTILEHGINAEIGERACLVAAMFSSFLFQYLFAKSDRFPLIYICLFCFQLWLWISAPLVALARVCPVYKQASLSFILAPLYIYFATGLIYLFTQDHTLLLFSVSMRYISTFLYFCLFLHWARAGYNEYIKSGMNLMPWYESLHDFTKTSVIVTVPMALMTIVFNFLIECLNDAQSGFDGFTVPFLGGYITLAIVSLLLITVIPGRKTLSSYEKVTDELELKRTYVRYVSHEIRTPLNIVNLGLELVEGQLDQKKPYVEILKSIQEVRAACQVGVDILNDLLAYEKLQSGLMTMEKKLVDPVDFFRAATDPFHIVAMQKNITLCFTNTIERNNVLVNIDETKVAQIVRNLLSNAIKFTPDGGTVKATVFAKNSSVELVVQDSGPGISLENQKKLFNNVVQFHANAQQGGGGSGVGLWISKKIADLHGGTISVHSDGEGHGARFTFVLSSTPFAGSVNELAATVGPRTLVDSTVHHTDRASLYKKLGMRVLVCDDVAMNRKMMRRRLEQEGMVVEEADDGDVAVAMIEAVMNGTRERFDVVTLDNVMPRMTGVAAVRKLRSLGYAGLVVGVTGNALDEDIAEFKEGGAHHVFTKPFDFAVFMSLVDSFIPADRLLEEGYGAPVGVGAPDDGHAGYSSRGSRSTGIIVLGQNVN